MDAMLEKYFKHNDAYRAYAKQHELAGWEYDLDSGVTNLLVEVRPIWLHMPINATRGNTGVLLRVGRDRASQPVPMTVAVAEQILAELPAAIEAAKQAQREYDASGSEEEE